jgi:RNA ligase (TIGR02306 family)
MARQLASIQKIINITEIQGAEKIETAQVLGWQCVVGKGQFKVDESIVYIEIDSIVPDTEPFQFIKPPTSTNEKWRRIKTRRFRKQISQGLVMSATILPVGVYKEGEDVTEILNIEKYEPPIPAELQGIIKGGFPTFLPKTDETRIQVLQDVLTRYKGIQCYITEKIDGSSCTIYLNTCRKCGGKDSQAVNVETGEIENCSECNGTSKEFGVCSRNLELKESIGNAFWMAVSLLDIEKKLRALDKNIAIQGELAGQGIQKNPLKIDGIKILFFNAFDIDKYKYYDCLDFISIITELGLETVPIISCEYQLTDNIEELVKLSIDKSAINKKVWREGIVIRPLIEKVDLQMSSGYSSGRVSFKSINPEYLLEHDE